MDLAPWLHGLGSMAPWAWLYGSMGLAPWAWLHGLDSMAPWAWLHGSMGSAPRLHGLGSMAPWAALRGSGMCANMCSRVAAGVGNERTVSEYSHNASQVPAALGSSRDGHPRPQTRVTRRK